MSHANLNDVAVNQSPTEPISSLSFSPTSNHFVAGSWDKHIRCWDIQANGAVPTAMVQLKAPPLCTAWSPDGTAVFAGTCDNTASMWRLAQGSQVQTVAQHAAPIKSTCYVNELSCLVTGSWDKTVKYWDLRTSNPQCSVNLPERVYSMDARGQVMAVATAEQHVQIFDLRKATVPFKEMTSALKLQSRCIALFADATGYTLGSIEGRVAVSFLNDNDVKKNFTYKCHRQENKAYAVNALVFHPKGQFASVGSDGTYAFWDKDSKQRIKLARAADNSISCAAFNRDGSIFAYAVSYDWSRGAEGYDKNKPNQIMLHAHDKK